MSAFDIAGAVIATPLAILFLATFCGSMASPGPVSDGTMAAFVWGIVTALWAAFCIARLCGAHL